MQIKLLVGTDYKDLEDQINAVVKTQKDATVDVNFETIAAVVTLNNEAKTMCMDCKFWDDEGHHDSIMGLCQCRGGRMRFNKSSCEEFRDRRG